MNNKQFNEMMAVIKGIDERVATLEKKLESEPKVSNAKPSTNAKVKTIADFEPLKDEKGFYIWASYKSRRRAYYCYKKGIKKMSKWDEDFAKVTAEFTDAYKYVKVEDR